MTVVVAERHNVSWAMMPNNNDRTAWRPFGLPMILVEPNRRNAAGQPLDNSAVRSVRIAIENVPRETLVAGHDHVGLRYPDRELYVRNVSTLDLYERQVDPSAQVFFTADGTQINFEDATTGDLMQFTTTSGVRDTITYIRSANYYDLSDILLEVEELAPDYYTISYQADYYVRVLSRTDEGELLCIDSSQIATSVFRHTINHPGQVIEETTRLTPQVYLSSQESKATDDTIGLYRPFTDILQDIYDELNLLQTINWVDKITPQFIPYLAFLLGLDIPFFPESLDSLRRTMLRNIVRLQQLKGSRRALIEMFELFGFQTYLINLYWAKDGSRLIRPGQEMPPAYADQEITIQESTQIEPLLADYDTDGFGEITVPLLFRPSSSDTREGIATIVEDADVVIDSYLVQKDSDAYAQLQAVVSGMNADPTGYGDLVGTLPQITGTGIQGYSQVVLEGPDGLGADETLIGAQPPFTKNGITFDRRQNILTMVFNGAILFSQPNQVDSVSGPGYALFSFATYTRQGKIIPAELENLQSNRFDVQLLTKAGYPVQADVLDFLIDFLFKLKAFHSLLNVIIYSVELSEVYNVTDFCVGGDFFYRFDTDAGQLQTPPAIVPGTPDQQGCYADAEDLGYSEEDVLLRSTIRARLDEEFEAWKALDSRGGQSQDGDTRLPTDTGSVSGTCQFTTLGQDRILTDGETESSEIEYGPGPQATNESVASQTNLQETPISEVVAGVWLPTGPDTSTASDSKGYGSFVREYSVQPDTLCELDGFTDYCYKGRVDDEVLHQSAIYYTESFRSHACRLSFGHGAYWIYPAIDKYGNKRALASIQSVYLQNNGVLPPERNNWLGRLLRAYDTPSDYTLHYSNRLYADANTALPTQYLALQRPELGVEKADLHFPGTRLASMGKLEADFVHPTYKAKPWDDLYSYRCGPDHLQCGNGPSYLNARLIVEANGDSHLAFDDEDFTILGNGLAADIPSFGDHTLGSDASFAETDVVHAVYLAQFAGHPAITLEQVGPCDGTYGDEGIALGDGLLEVENPLFLSAGECEDGSRRDYCGGYAYNSGYQDLGDLDLDRSGLYSDLFEAMGVPFNQDPTDTQVLFLLISGIRDGSDTYRFDCGCLLVDCGTAGTHPGGPILLDCNADLFVDQEGSRDYNADQLSVIPRVVLEETVGVHSYFFDGEIPSFFELIREDTASFSLKVATDWWWDSEGEFERYNVFSAVFGANLDGVQKNIGLLFANVTIEPLSTILTSYLRFKASDTGGHTTVSVSITAYDADDPSAAISFTEASTRTRLSTTVAWSNVPVWYAGIWYHSVDITALLQKIVDRDGWISGNNIVLNVEDNGSDSGALRHLYMKGSGFAPELVIGYRRPF